MHQYLKPRRACLLAGCAATALGAGGVHAQDAADAEAAEERIVVTGSRIARSDFTSISPITQVDSAELDARAIFQLEDLARELTTINGGQNGSRVNNGSGGQADISLRGLGANRTLVLVNGQRLAPSNTSGTVDLNLLPVGMISSIEVLRDGASTIYGSDAIAGVINIITKQEFDGFEGFAQYDVTDKGDGNIYRIGATLGRTFEDGHLTLGGEYYRRDPIFQRDRDFSAAPLGEATENGQRIVREIGSGTTTPAQIIDSADPINGTGTSLIVDQTTGLVRPFTNDDTFNFAATSLMVTPQEVYSAYGNGRVGLFDSDLFGSVDATFDFLLANRTSQQNLAPEGTFFSPRVPGFHPFNPLDRDVFIARRLAEVPGGRFFSQDATSYRIIAGFEGELTNGITWDTSINWGNYTDSRLELGRLNPTRTAEILCYDPASIEAGACASPAVLANPNLIWDPFNSDTLTPEIQAYALVPNSPIQRIERLTFQANVAGDTGAFRLPGGAIEWAAGYESRREKAEFIPDGAAAIGQIFFVSGQATAGDFRVNELYGETRFPILAGLPFADLLAVEASARQSFYSFGGEDGGDLDTFNYKAAVEYAPVADFRLRAVYATGFRAPSIGELFAPQTQSAQQYNEPCLNWGANPNPVIQANCAADGLPPTFNLTSSQSTSLLGGNPDLDPEESESLTIGAVATPSRFPWISASVDWFNVEITEAIGTAGTDNVITGCYESENFSSPLCGLIRGPALVGESPFATSPRREAIGTISGVLLTNANLATFEVEGVDFAIDLNGPAVDVAGRMVESSLSWDATYTSKYDYLPFEGAELVEAAGTIAEDQFQGNPAAFPEWRMSFLLGLRSGSFGANWDATYMSEVDDINASPSNLVNTAPEQWYHGISLNYDLENVSFQLGARNIFDEDPPYITNYDDMNTIQFSYDTAGRYYFGRVVVRR